MKLTSFFIKHPVIAIILNAMIVIVGLLSLQHVNVREYPDVKLPVISVYARYPNASPELVENNVTNVIEDQLAGIAGIENIVSHSLHGMSRIELKFQEGASIERALIAVNEAMTSVRANLPKEVEHLKIQQSKHSDGLPFIAISISSDSLTFGELNHYTNLHLKNAFRSIKGVSSVEVWGQPYTMQVTLDPRKMYGFGINADDIYAAIERNNVSLPTGKYQNQIPTTLDLNLSNVSDFENLFIKEKNGQSIYLKSVADLELKTDDQQFRIRINGKEGLVLAINHAIDANPLEVSQQINEQLKHLQQVHQDDVSLSTVLDRSEFIKASLANIKFTILEAILLVVVIVFLFLKSMRAAIIPLVTIPVSLIGAIIFIKIMGFSINTISLLAMVLAIGLVVDDAIVVLENITRHIENGLSPMQAAIKGSGEIGFAIIAMTLTLACVYAPIAFVTGAIGQLFIEFSVALAGAVLISGIVALTLTPLMCTKLTQAKPRASRNSLDNKSIDVIYGKLLSKTLASNKTIVGITLFTLCATIFMFSILPKEIAPKEDRSLMGVYIPTLPGKDINYFEQKVLAVEDTLKSIPEANSYFTFMGDWGANIIFSLEAQDERNRTPEKIIESLQSQLKSFPSIDVWPWSWDSGLPGLDDAIDGTQLTLAISTLKDYRDLFTQVDQVRKEIENEKIFPSAFHNLRLDNPGLQVQLDKDKASKLGIKPSQVSSLIEIFFSGQQALSFQKDGIRYPVTLIGRTSPWTLDELYITNAHGKRISLGAIASLQTSVQPKELYHYNQMRTALLSVTLNKDQKIESGMNAFWNKMSSSLPHDLKKEWIGAAKSYTKSNTTMTFLFILALCFIYAVLAIQFENFVDPFIIMMTVPLACFGALLAALFFKQSINIYTQIGLVTLIGLITKHGILMVEFANQLHRAGQSLEQAIQSASTRRLRPILMTTGAMILGALPLAFSQGAGHEARHAIGIIIIGGLTLGTCFTLLILPKIYLMVKSRRYFNARCSIDLAVGFNH
ncbi:MAG: efflux RND transporter permease subunit [Gammaproteobacteria bacterium]|jgi:multidrug efflux pump|nr:efflux RND transporter permease subunit [Gammaproteobacteria bacterium]